MRNTDARHTEVLQSLVDMSLGGDVEVCRAPRRIM
jgi:hypothetical protein